MRNASSKIGLDPSFSVCREFYASGVETMGHSEWLSHGCPSRCPRAREAGERPAPIRWTGVRESPVPCVPCRHRSGRSMGGVVAARRASAARGANSSGVMLSNEL